MEDMSDILFYRITGFAAGISHSLNHSYVCVTDHKNSFAGHKTTDSYHDNLHTGEAS